MKRLTEEQICLLQNLLIDDTGGIKGVRDPNLLNSALNSPFQTFDGAWLYPDIEEKAARLAYTLIKNHPFIDGNKRIGILAMLTFLEWNGVKIDFTNDELVDIGYKVADGSLNAKELYMCIKDKSGFEPQ